MSDFVRMGNKYADPVTGNMMTVTGVRDGIVFFQNGASTPIDNIDVYRYVGNDTPDDTPDGVFDVVGGVLRYAGKDISCGTLRVREVVSPCKRGAVVIVEGLETGHDLFFYDLYEDRFRKLLHEDGELRPVWKDGDVDCALILARKETPVKDGEEMHTSVSERLFIVNSGRIYDEETLFDANFGGPVNVICKKNDDNNAVVVLTATSNQEFVTRYTEGNSIAFCSEEDGKYVTRQFVIRVKHEETGDVFAADMYEFGTASRPIRIQPVYDGNNSVIIVTDDEILYTNIGYAARRARGKDVVKAFLNSPYLVRLEPGRTKNVFVLCDEDHKITKITVTKTEDRGYVTEIA